jgi:glucose-6-phosphate-specific signal transduction histidine kinase
MSTRISTWLLALAVIAGVVILGDVDLVTGYELNFFVFYFLPVSVMAWRLGFPAAVIVAVLSAIVWSGADLLSGHAYSSHAYAVWNTMIRLLAFLVIGWSVARVRQGLVRERETTEALRQAISEVKVLETFLPICAQCKRIRNKEGVWQELEVYIGQHSNTQFSHGYCPECARRALEEAGLAGSKTEP